jgi:hypothetical protein
VNLDGRFGALVRSPGKQGQAEVDDGRVQGKDGFLKGESERLVGIQSAGFGDEGLGEVGVDPPVALFIGVGQGIARDQRAAKPHVIEAWLHGAQAGLDVPQALAIGQLGKRQGEELIHAGKALHLVLATVALHTAMKLLDGEQGHDLREDGAAGVHAPGCHRWRMPFKSFPPQNPCKQQESIYLSAAPRTTLGQQWVQSIKQKQEIQESCLKKFSYGLNPIFETRGIDALCSEWRQNGQDGKVASTHRGVQTPGRRTDEDLRKH